MFISISGGADEKSGTAALISGVTGSERAAVKFHIGYGGGLSDIVGATLVFIRLASG